MYDPNQLCIVWGLLRTKLSLNVNIWLIHDRQWSFRSRWKCLLFLGKVLFYISYSCLKLFYRSKGPMPWLHFLSQIEAFSHQGRVMVDPLTLLLLQNIFQSTFARYPRFCQKSPSNCKHTGVHIHSTFFHLYGWNHPSIHWYHPNMIQSPSASYRFSGDAKSRSLHIYPHTVPIISLLSTLMFQSKFHSTYYKVLIQWGRFKIYIHNIRYQYIHSLQGCSRECNTYALM